MCKKCDSHKDKLFFDEIESVCKKHNISISHEDGHGAFMLEEYDELYTKWLRGAYRDIEEIKEEVF